MLLKKLKIDVPYNSGIPLLDIYPKECYPGYNRGTCIPVARFLMNSCSTNLTGGDWKCRKDKG
jgi:hypothetical protein